MDSHLSTTPFGRRTLPHVRTASQALLKHDPPIGRIKGADLTRFRARPFGVGPSMRLCGAHTTAANESTKGSNRDYLASGGGAPGPISPPPIPPSDGQNHTPRA